MLASNPDYGVASGVLGRDVQKPRTFLYEVIEFIAAELPKWRDKPDRPAETAEKRLTTQLCGHLNTDSRLSTGFDILQFRVEEPDAQKRSRTLDLVPAPCGVAIVVDGRRHIDFEALLPIECKRLPTPKENNRDEREYVYSQNSTTGGIQGFKSGHHGASHELGAMIGFVQQETSAVWLDRTANWIRTLTAACSAGWTEDDLLRLEKLDPTLRVTILRSAHDRGIGNPIIELRHLWIEMN